MRQSDEAEYEYAAGDSNERKRRDSHGELKGYVQECYDGYTHSHDHTHSGNDTHTHTHAHTHQNTKAVLNRLARAIGHLEKVRQMVEDGVDCSEVLIQLSAVRSAINNTGKIILKDHIEHCLVEAIENGDMETVEELNRAIDQFMK